MHARRQAILRKQEEARNQYPMGAPDRVERRKMVEAHFASLLHDYRVSDDPVRAYGEFRSRCANTECEYLFWDWNANIDGGRQ